MWILPNVAIGPLVGEQPAGESMLRKLRAICGVGMRVGPLRYGSPPEVACAAYELGSKLDGHIFVRKYVEKALPACFR